MSSNMRDVFTKIHDEWLWGIDNESRSGSGSSVKEASVVISLLPKIFKQYQIKTVLDASCGDFNWMKHVDLDNVIYTGSDIVEDLIKENTKKYGKENISFICSSVADDPIQKSDLIILRDTLFHFSNNDIFRTINNIKQSGATYLLTTSYEKSDHVEPTNIDINTGGWRFLNLEMEPFHFPNPIYRIYEVPGLEFHEDRTLSLWKISDLPTY